VEETKSYVLREEFFREEEPSSFPREQDPRAVPLRTLAASLGSLRAGGEVAELVDQMRQIVERMAELEARAGGGPAGRGEHALWGEGEDTTREAVGKEQSPRESHEKDAFAEASMNNWGQGTAALGPTFTRPVPESPAFPRSDPEVWHSEEEQNAYTFTMADALVTLPSSYTNQPNTEHLDKTSTFGDEAYAFSSPRVDAEYHDLSPEASSNSVVRAVGPGMLGKHNRRSGGQRRVDWSSHRRGGRGGRGEIYRDWLQAR
jgi:hypothetical protein